MGLFSAPGFGDAHTWFDMRDAVHRWAQKRTVVVALLMASYSAQSLLINASKQNGSFPYDAGGAVLLAEVVKLGFTMLMLPPGCLRSMRPSMGCLLFAVPAGLYIVQNRLVFEALRHLSPPEYQMLNNMKLLTTSAVYRMVMQRRLTILQWLALVLLAVGMTVATMEPVVVSDARSVAATRDETEGGALVGLGCMLIVAWCSAFASVSNEWLIKRSTGVLEANFWLYVFGLFPCCWQIWATPGAWPRLLRLEGFSMLTWSIIFCNAVLGQTIAFLLRHADSIVKLYAVCAAMAFTTAMSVLLFGFEVRFNMVAGYLTTAVSMGLYYTPQEVLLAKDSDVLAGVCSGKRHANGAGKVD